MLNALYARLCQGYRTGKFPDAEPSLPDRFSGLPQWDVTVCDEACHICADHCPTGAITRQNGNFSLDTGRCIFCNECANVCPVKALTFSREYRLAAMHRKNLIVDGSIRPIDFDADPELRKYCGKSLKIRQVSAGGCAACELDFNVLNTLAWDMGRFGIQVVASPRHADCLLVTGPVSKNMILALQKTYEAMPKPAWVIACGTCAISGGLYADSPETANGVEDFFKVYLYVPGCPPHPATLLEALVRLMGRRR